MAIRTDESTRETRGACSIVIVEVSDEHGVSHGWEFTCAACDGMDTMLTHDEAVLELAEHVCPEIPPCEMRGDED